MNSIMKKIEAKIQILFYITAFFSIFFLRFSRKNFLPFLCFNINLNFPVALL